MLNQYHFYIQLNGFNIPKTADSKEEGMRFFENLIEPVSIETFFE